MSPTSVLETQRVPVEHDGTTTTEPLWRALQIAGHATHQAAILDVLAREVLRPLLNAFFTTQRARRRSTWPPTARSTSATP